MTKDKENVKILTTYSRHASNSMVSNVNTAFELNRIVLNALYAAVEGSTLISPEIAALRVPFEKYFVWATKFTVHVMFSDNQLLRMKGWGCPVYLIAFWTPYDKAYTTIDRMLQPSMNKTMIVKKFMASEIRSMDLKLKKYIKLRDIYPPDEYDYQNEDFYGTFHASTPASDVNPVNRMYLFLYLARADGVAPTAAGASDITMTMKMRSYVTVFKGSRDMADIYD